MIYISEGFATLFQYHIPGYLRPFMRAIDFFNVQVMQSVFRTDSLDTTRSMSRRAETLAEVGQSFDSISYSKAGSVLRMMLHSVGDEVFRDIMELYLHTKYVQKRIFIQFVCLPINQIFQCLQIRYS